MNLRKGFLSLGLGLFSLAATDCGSSDDDEPECTAPVIHGTPFGFQGTATVHGTGSLPAGVGADGAELDLLVNTGNASYGVLPMNFTDVLAWNMCGRSFSFELDQMEAGTYRLDYDIYAHGGDTDPSATRTSTNSFTVTDGADVEFDPIF